MNLNKEAYRPHNSPHKMNLEEIRSLFLSKLRTYKFRSEEEAKSLGLTEYTISHEHVPIPLETPFCIQPKCVKSSKMDLLDEDVTTYEISESSSSEISNDEGEVYHDDIHMNIQLSIKSKLIIDQCELTIVRGNKYGLVGRNGIGKTTLLRHIKKRKFNIPRGISIYMIEQECTTNIKVIDHVGDNGSKILTGFGFNKEMMDMNIQELSGGWKMRAHLAKAININPDLLLLDEPTNYLDINALTWLEKMIRTLKTVIIVSHDRQFLNNVVEEILHINDYKIIPYKGNYDSFYTQRENKIKFMKKEYENQLREREHIQSFIDRWRYNSKRASLAQSKIKQLAKMPPLNPPKVDPQISFKFDSTPCKGVLVEMRDVRFGYVKGKEIFENITISITNKSRIVVVGANGQGKSTFLKMLTNNLENCDGYINKSTQLQIGYFAQHHVDNLNVNERVLDLMLKKYTYEDSKRALANFGLNVDNQRIGHLSGGQKSRLTMALINIKKPNLLIFDEPTNHLDMESIDALAECIRKYEGGVVCVSHDMNFISGTFNEVYVCENKILRYFAGSAQEYKDSMKMRDI